MVQRYTTERKCETQSCQTPVNALRMQSLHSMYNYMMNFTLEIKLTFNVEGSCDDLNGVATPVAAPVALVARLQVRHADRAL